MRTTRKSWWTLGAVMLGVMGTGCVGEPVDEPVVGPGDAEPTALGAEASAAPPASSAVPQARPSQARPLQTRPSQKRPP